MQYTNKKPFGGHTHTHIHTHTHTHTHTPVFMVLSVVMMMMSSFTGRTISRRCLGYYKIMEQVLKTSLYTLI